MNIGEPDIVDMPLILFTGLIIIAVSALLYSILCIIFDFVKHKEKNEAHFDFIIKLGSLTIVSIMIMCTYAAVVNAHRVTDNLIRELINFEYYMEDKINGLEENISNGFTDKIDESIQDIKEEYQQNLNSIQYQLNDINMKLDREKESVYNPG